MSAIDPSVRVIDADSHVYEPEALWADHVPAADRETARRAFSRQDGGIVLNGEPARPLDRSTINRRAVWRPGMTPADIGRLDPAAVHAINPGAADAAARLADLDTLGIEQQIVFPTLFGEYFPEVEDAAAAAVLARAYNDWAHELARDGAGRLHPAAVLPLQDVSAALDELARVADRGFRSVLIRPMFQRVAQAGDARAGAGGQAEAAGMGSANPNGVYVDHASLRPVWAAIEARGLVACVHPYLGIANREAVSEGSFVERVAERLGIGHTVAEPVAYLQDGSLFVVVAAFHGLLENHPDLKLALLHSGASMVPLSLEKAETYLWLSPGSIFSQEAPVSLEPAEVFERSRVIVGFDAWESSVVRLPDFFATRAAWGSRYPHHDAAAPAEVLALCAAHDVPADVVARLVGGNAADLFGLGVLAGT